MERAKKSLVFLDTHIVNWLYDSLTKKFSKKAISTINEGVICVSPIVLLELEYLYEVKKIRSKPAQIIESLSNSIGLSISETPLSKIINVALTLEWTRDLFDRILVSEAEVNNALFVTKDRTIRDNYPLSVW